MTMANSTRLNININDETAAALRSLADKRDATITETIRRAVSVTAFFRQARTDGKRIHLIAPDGKTTEVTFL